MDKKVIETNKTLRGEAKIDFQSGDVIKVFLKIKEGEKERVQVFEGLVIAIKGKQSSSPMLTVRKISNGVGVEMIVPILSKNVEKIELVKRAKVRRAKLYYVRDLTAKQSRMKYSELKDFIVEEKPEVPEAEDVKKEIVKKVEAEKKEESKEASKK
jgi:large subunit ribosomal protein L19